MIYGGASAPGTGGVLALSDLDGSNGFILNGINVNDQSGLSVSSAGDVNGDGYGDLIIGAYLADSNGVDSGETYLVYGGAGAPGTGGVLELSDLDGSNGFILNGIDAYDRSAFSVSSAGDVNGDGYDDLIIGAYRADQAGNDEGETYVVYGGASAPGTGGVLALSDLDGSNGFILNGIDTYDYSGVSVSSAGDVNGDGYDDLIIGADRADPNGNNSGETYVVYGGASAPGTGGVLALSALDGANGFILNGIDPNDRSGHSVSSAGDVNGDGYDDLIIGAYGADDPAGENYTGETYLVYGGASAPGAGGVLALSDLDDSNGFALAGIEGDDQSGIAVSSAGDVNGDGYDDLIIGARGADPNGNRSGESYVVYGGATGTESTAPATGQGTVSADNFTGNAGGDSFTGIATGDVVRGGAGDDSIGVTALDFADIDGGTGKDTLVLAGANLSLDLTGPGNGGVDSVEVIDLSGAGANTLVLDALAVLNLTEERDGGLATLEVLGGADDRVDLSNGDFTADGTATADGRTYNVYRDGNAEVRVETGVQVQLLATAAPVFTSEATADVVENQTEAYTAMATDEDSATLTYGLTGTDAALFTIDPVTGVVSFIAAPDFENGGDAGGDNVYDVIVTASDGDNITSHDVAIRVTNVNDNTPAFTSAATANAAENQTAAYTAMATDADGDALSYSLSGTDAALFTIDPAMGVVSFMAAPDFEAPGDMGGDNVYDITVTASDGDNSNSHDVAIRVTNVNDNIPAFTSDATVGVAENQTTAYTAMAMDGDGDDLTYSLSGTDAALFMIDPTTGVVSFLAAPDFENPGDNGGDNVYDITVTASDGDNNTDQAVAITVMNENEVGNPPIFTSPDSASVAENQSLAYTAVATDAEGDDLTYSLSGTDAALFTIDPTTGEVSFMAAPDFENPGDDDEDNVYNITVTALDETNATNQAVAIRVTNVNDNTPSFTSDASVNAAENQTAAYTAIAADADGDDLSYSLSGTDAALFTIDPTTGVVSFVAPPDFENPGDVGGDNVYDITVTASDDSNESDHDVAIRVTNVNDNTPSFTSDASAGAAENQTAAYTAIAADADGDDLTYGLSGTDAALFTIDPTTGVVRFRAAPDFENPGDAGGDNVYDITVTASDNINESNQDVAIRVTNVNDNTPAFTSDASVNAAENQTAAYTAVATDGDGDDLSYSLSGTDAALFTIDPTTGEVSFTAAPDFENPGDAGGDNVYDITVTASDNINESNQDVAIRVTNVNDNTPAFTSDATAAVAENQTAAYTAIAADADGDDLSYGLSGTDAALFTIDPTTGEVSFRAAPDFENPGDAGGDNVYDITVTASDDTNITNHDVAITVTNVNDNTPSFTSDASVNAAENQTAAYTAVATDADDDALSYSLSGTDAALFTIDPATGEVSFMVAPDFENPGDAGGDNIYDITVTTSDGDNTTNHDVAITVTNVNDNTPSFTSPGSANVAESQTAAYTAIAADADGDDLSYGLSGTDAALFTIDPTTGEVSFIAAPDFENPGDAGEDNVYDIIVTATDNTNATDHAVAITVTNENDNDPIFTSGNSAGVPENQSADSVVYAAQATDADGDPLSYSLSGTDAALFTIDPATGAVRFTAAPDFENPGDDDDDNVYDITVTASDDSNETEHNVAITVANENDNTPSFTSDATANVAENQTAAYTAVAADADGDPLTYSLSGTDAALFTIDPTTGVVSFVTQPDFENPGDNGGDNVYDITVTASDDTNEADHNVAITVTNENDNSPIFTSDATVSVAENLTVAYTAMATDADGDPLTYSLSGTDAALFTIDSDTGVVSFMAAPDFEMPGDAGGNNVYDIIVTASDGSNETQRPVAITVTDNAAKLSILDGSNGFILNGIDTNDYSGFSVSSAGDVNGDGYDDLIIGAWGGDVFAGETYVVYGGASAPGTAGVLDLSALDGAGGFILNGLDAGDQLGRSVSSAGDVNGDGYDDLIIGARGAAPNGNLSGETYVIYGGASAPGTGGVLALSDLDGSNGFILNGINVNDQSGLSVSSAGDVNGDGYDDLIIGAYLADPNGVDSGEAYLVYGGAGAPGTGGVLELSDLDGSNGFILNGIDGADRSAFSVSSAGDVNGDGYDDLIIGAYRADPGGDDEGETYVVYGGASAPGTGGVLALSDLDGSNGFILNGIDTNDYSGVSVSSAGDVNGDGYDDLIIGADRADPNGNNSGETYVVYGGASAPGTGGVLALSALDGANGFILNGIDPNDRSGHSVSSAGDVNGDGYDDLIIGAYGADDPAGQNYTGETYLVYGGASAPGAGGVLALSELDDSNGFALAGIEGDDQSGIAVSSAGDVNGDGYDDLIIGARGADPNGNRSGESYVVYGGATGTESTAPLTGQGTAGADNFTGNAGGDSFTGIATGDVVRGGAGDDSIGVTALDFADIDGGTGKDTLMLAGANLSLDLRGTGNGGVDSVEVIDLSGAGANTLVLDALAVLNLTEERDGGLATLEVLGGADDRVDLSNGDFIADGMATADGRTYNVYRDGNAEVRVETGVQVQLLATAAPVFTSEATADVVENQTEVYTATATDEDSATLTYGLTGTDAALFTIDPVTGVVSFIAAPDFENAGDAGGDNVYDIIVTASDGDNITSHDVAIRVTNVNDNTPAFTSAATANAAENQTAAYTAMATDADGDALSYSLSGTDAALFTIDPAAGVVSFVAAPDFEAPGDMGGDNVYDITVTASDGDNTASHDVAITVTDEYEPFELSTLDGSNGFTASGINAGDLSGMSVSSAGDVNSDGYDDLLIGAIGADPNGNNSGATYLVYGGASAPGAAGVVNLSALDGSNGFVLNGIDTYDSSGISVSSAGDVNGDGYDDLIIGANYAAPDENNSGATYVVYGGATGTAGVVNLSALDGSNGFTLNGIDEDDYSGVSVSSAGDVNGDGYDDLIIGSGEAGPNGNGSGETYVIYGGASAPGTAGVLALSDLNGANGFIISGIDADDSSGFSVSSAGDVNGDGYDDLIIGAYRADPGGNDEGETYVVYGGATGTEGVLSLSMLNGANGFILAGIDPNDQSGISVSSAGDVNGDGYDDLIIGAFGADPNGSNSGETYVVYGGASAPGSGGVLALSDLNGANSFIITGIDANDSSGFSVSSAGDVNGDGYDDLIIGGWAANPNGERSGETYVVYGGASAPGTGGVLALSALDGANGFALNGIDPGDYSGYSVSSAGDVNGDGYDDLVIGARGADPNGDRSGEIYLVYGGATGTESTVPVTAQGTAGVDNFTGNAGADSFTGIATGDVVRGGAGDDSISATALDFADIDGGTGRDTLVLAGANLSLDLRGPGNGGVDNVEVVDLSGAGANTLVLDALAVFNLTEERAGGIATLDVLGDADDRVDLSNSDFTGVGTATADGTTYNVYRDGNAEVRVQTGIQLQLPPTPAPVFTSEAIVSVAENQALLYTATATDEDSTTLTYGLTGTDAALFTIDPVTGVVSFAAPPDFEAPGDVGGDNVYDITVTASDGNNTTSHDVAITVTNVNDNDPAFTSAATANAAENQTAAYTAVATDADEDSLTYSLSGTDAALFTIDPAAGVVSFAAPPDFEAPGDMDGDNVYDITVTASDGDNTTDHDVAITVTNVNDNDPAFTSAATAGLAENQAAAYTAIAADADGDSLTYGLTGTDAASFTIDPATGVVSFAAPPDFEAPGDMGGDNVYDISVTAFDGDNSISQDVAITVTNVNDNDPAFTSAATANLAENQTAAYTAIAADADGDSLTYGLTGTDAALFTIDPVTGVTSFMAAPDFENPGDVGGDNVYDITVTASDGDNTTNHDVAITVTNVNDNDPAFTSAATASLAENQVVAYTAIAADADGDNLTYGLTGTDAALFTIDPATGVVGFAIPPDFEAPGDVGGDNVYDITVTASDGDNTASHDVAITVTDEEYEPMDLGTLDGANGFILSGIDANDQSGRSVSSAGDVNGDGYDDLIIGAYGGDPNGNNSGETYLVYGGASAPGTAGVLALSALNGTNGFILAGIGSNDFSGRSVSSAGDVNGDGYDDLIIGANQAESNGNYSGETYVVYGGASAPGTAGVLALSDLDGSNGFTLSGIGSYNYSGISVSSAGDVNGDGYDDLIVGTLLAGDAYVVYGGASAPGTGGVLNLSALDGSNGFSLDGTGAADYSGYSVSSAGDVNGDGYDDLIIGAYGTDASAGETYVVYGGASAPGTGGVLALSDLNGADGFVLAGIDAIDRFGRSLSSAGDVNGDGYDDLIIGANRADPNGDGSGETYVVYGGASAPGTGGVLALSDLNGANGFILAGVDAGDYSGISVSSAGDVNGDGYDDLIIGAYGAALGRYLQAGETYVVYGGATGTAGVVNLSALDGSNGFILAGIDAGDNSGIAVSSAGDVNGDGYDDLIIGARGADPNGNRSGETYLVYGGATGTESTVPVTAQGTAGADNFTGNAGADSFTGIATGDVVRGGAGDDSISVTALDFADIDGGTGEDTLVLDGAGLSLDLTGAGHGGVDSVEVFDLSGTGGNTLVLDALAVFDLTEERAGGIATLDVLGDADDTVELRDSNFAFHSAETEDTTTYNVYRDGNAEVRVQNGVTVTTGTTSSSLLSEDPDPVTLPASMALMDNGPRHDQLHDQLHEQWHEQQSGLWDQPFQADGLDSLDMPHRHRLNQEPVFEDLSLRDSIPDRQDSGGDAALIPLPVPAPMAQPVFPGDTPLQNELVMILREMDIFADPANNGDTDMDGF